MRRLPSARWAAAVAALLLLVVSPLQCRRETANRLVLLRQWQTTGAATRQPDAASRARRDPDPLASGVALARVLFIDAYDTRSIATMPRTEAAAAARRAESGLALAGTRAEVGLTHRPASWESAMVLGAARLLTAWRSDDEDLYRRPERWRAPLLQARSLAPGSPEPQRLLVTGYLATWQALSEEDRVVGRRLVRQAFQDPDTLGQLLPAWAAVATSRAELESVLPAEPGPYELLQQAAARQQDWPGFCAARERWLPLTLGALQERLAEAQRRLAGGDEHGGRGELLATASAAPPDQRTVALFSRAVEQLPPGQVGGAEAHALAGWLGWALPLWQLEKETLAPAVLARLASLSADLPPSQAALAALAGGDLERAEIWERRADRLWSEEWAPYAAAKAEVLLSRGHSDEAAAVLDEVHRSYRERWPYLRARERLAEARREPPPPRPETLATVTWGGEQWLYLGGEASLELVAARAAPGLVVKVDVAPAEGAVVELSWDGLSTGCLPVRPGEMLRLPAAVTTGPHRLVWHALAGGRTAPGAVELLAGAAAP